MLETTIVGSLPKPQWLAEPEKLWAPWRLEGPALEQAKKDAALVWIKEQEDDGIDIISNGEQFRIHFVHGFLEHIEGIDWAKKTTLRSAPRVRCVRWVTFPSVLKLSLDKSNIRNGTLPEPLYRVVISAVPLLVTATSHAPASPPARL